jgi:hypothetical protein
MAKRLLCFWAAVVIALVGVPCATALPTGLALIVMVAVLCGAFGLVIIALKVDHAGAH